jgi:Mg2+ and Co2+ transporter CorA
MSPDKEEPPEFERLRKALEAANQAATRMELGKAVPDAGLEREIRDLDEIRRQTDEALAALAGFEHGEHAARIVKALERSTTTLVNAMTTNAEAIGGALTEKDETAFPADEAVLAEGRFLKEQLTGVEGTEGRSPLFSTASIAVGASGFEVLADAVNDAEPSSYSTGTT